MHCAPAVRQCGTGGGRAGRGGRGARDAGCRGRAPTDAGGRGRGRRRREKELQRRTRASADRERKTDSRRRGELGAGRGSQKGRGRDGEKQRPGSLTTGDREATGEPRKSYQHKKRSREIGTPGPGAGRWGRGRPWGGGAGPGLDVLLCCVSRPALLKVDAQQTLSSALKGSA